MPPILPASIIAPFRRKPVERRPSPLLWALESRALLEWATIPAAMPWLLLNVPRGDGHSVMVLPGLMAGDASTLPLRRFLDNRGYDSHGWGEGINRGPVKGITVRLLARLEELRESSGRKVSLIGWSLGGIFARELARAQPDSVRQVISLGSPLYGPPQSSTNAWELYRLVRSFERDSEERGEEAPPVPTTSIYSRADGIVGWGGSVEKRGALTDNIEVNCASHIGLGVHPLVWYAIGDRLAQAEDQWSRFRPRGLKRALFPFRAPKR
ncbi:lipase family alpha/beta hydrolase [Pseudomonas citronellolis]|uniref:lipase family alpha/beta hydrolase n=1 Tax=Pseudomonas citronellolis TaxID=53408 RepID=UPI0023E3D73C|nr:alpha/beta hydrolase [Pseudomonas citronellolis]MDF3933902.1 alpha/beta hydrolase [Pseudomonas citronellolis]